MQPQMCEPRFATRRRPERPTLGHRVERISRRLGTPLMEWQQMVANVGLEMVQARNGILVPAYREVVVTIPRQNGKTTLVLSFELDRALNWGGPRRIAYTAQTGNDARKKLLNDQVPLIERSPLGVAIEAVRRVNGSEGVEFRNGSQIDVLASSASAGHGRTLDLGVIDEAFDDTDDRREQSMLPAMVTRAEAQLLVVSTMGTDASVYLNRKVDAGRSMVLQDRDDSEIAYFEWSADDDADIDDPLVWQTAMPAFDLTIGERAVRHARETMSEGEFRRAFLNQRTAADERVIPLDVWNAICGDTQPGQNPSSELVLAIECDPERDSSSIGVADREGRCELVHHDRGTSWVVPEAIRLSRELRAPVAYNPGGPAGVFGDDLVKAGIRVIPVTGRDLGHACSFFFDGCVDRKLRIRSHDALNAAIAAARRRVAGDTWTWALSTGGDTDISPIVTLTMASWAVVHARKPTFLY